MNGPKNAPKKEGQTNQGNPVDIEELVRNNPNHPQRGQGFNDARGEIEDEVPPEQNYQKNNLKPPAKKDPYEQPERK